MKIARLALFALLVLLAHTAIASAFEREGISLIVPLGFQGPISERFDANTVTTAYTRLHSGTRGTLLQISEYDFAEKMPALKPQQLGAAAETYIAQFLKGIERRRQSFVASAITRITLGGIPAARVTWTGTLEGNAVHGVMFCVVIGGRVIAFHAQDFDAAPREYLEQAVQAIEAVRFKHDG